MRSWLILPKLMEFMKHSLTPQTKHNIRVSRRKSQSEHANPRPVTLSATQIARAKEARTRCQAVGSAELSVRWTWDKSWPWALAGALFRLLKNPCVITRGSPVTVYQL
jgi:hypothetical protein